MRIHEILKAAAKRKGKSGYLLAKLTKKRENTIRSFMKKGGNTKTAEAIAEALGIELIEQDKK